MFARDRQAAGPSDMKWLLLASVLLTPTGEEMTCLLAQDIINAAETRTIYLEGERDKVSSGVEKMTLDAEITGLWDLRSKMVHWRFENCK